MIWSHGIPDASVVSLLLLLCFTHSGLSRNCIFPEQLFPTTDPFNNIKGLKELMLLDYPVSMPSNLKPDELCFDFWQLYFISKQLSHMIKVAGSQLSKNITRLEARMNLKELFEDCKIESEYVSFERTNVSMFLDSIPEIFKKVREKMVNSTDFSNCTRIQCQPDSVSTPYPGYSSQILENSQASKSPVLQRHHWLLIPISFLVCLFSVVKFSSRTSFQPLPLQV